jgi:hypothetical protein
MILIVESSRTDDFEHELSLLQANDSSYACFSTYDVSSEWSPAQKRAFFEAAAANEVSTELYIYYTLREKKWSWYCPWLGYKSSVM